jgi:hypothetical protein
MYVAAISNKYNKKIEKSPKPVLMKEREGRERGLIFGDV